MMAKEQEHIWLEQALDIARSTLKYYAQTAISARAVGALRSIEALMPRTEVERKP
jgi:hypothetical protein